MTILILSFFEFFLQNFCEAYFWKNCLYPAWSRPTQKWLHPKFFLTIACKAASLGPPYLGYEKNGITNTFLFLYCLTIFLLSSIITLSLYSPNLYWPINGCIKRELYFFIKYLCIHWCAVWGTFLVWKDASFFFFILFFKKIWTYKKRFI